MENSDFFVLFFCDFRIEIDMYLLWSDCPIRTHPLRVFETVKVVNHASRLRSRCPSPGVPGSSPVSARSSRTSTPRTSYYGSDGASLQMDDKAPPINQCEDQR